MRACSPHSGGCCTFRGANLSDYYPAFVPPGDLSATEPRSWTKNQADAYFNWLMSVKQERVEALLDFSGEKWPRYHVEQDLLRIGTKATQFLQLDEFSNQHDLLNSGYAFAADLGLLVAEMLIVTDPSIRWTVLRKPKSDLSYNLPVLCGFGVLTLDPISGSIAEASGILRGERSGEVWREIYCFWLEKAAERASGPKIDV